MKKPADEVRDRPAATKGPTGQAGPLEKSRRKERRLFYWVCVWAAFSGLACGGVYAIQRYYEHELSHPKPGPRDPFEYERFLFAYAFYVDAALVLLTLSILIMIIVMIRWLMMMKHNRQMA